MKQNCFLHLRTIITHKIKLNTLSKEMIERKYKYETSFQIPMPRYYPEMNFPKQSSIFETPKWMGILSPHEQHTHHNGK